MEDISYETVKNNILGTNNLASLSDELKVVKFFMISSDKAVNPIN